MAWIESHQELRNHPKIFDLMTAMGWDLDTTIGKLHRFWWWCVDYAEDGDLTKHNHGRIAAAMGVDPTQADHLVDSLVAIRWLDREPYFRVHDWWDYIGLFLTRKYGERNRPKWERVKQLYNSNTTAIQRVRGVENTAVQKTDQLLAQPNLTVPNQPVRTHTQPSSMPKQDPASTGQEKAVCEEEDSPDPPIELPARFPRTVETAISNCLPLACPEAFIRKVWNKAMGRGGLDSNQVPILNWVSYVSANWAYEQERELKFKKEQENRQNGNKNYRPNHRNDGTCPTTTNYREVLARKERERQSRLAGQMASPQIGAPSNASESGAGSAGVLC